MRSTHNEKMYVGAHPQSVPTSAKRQVSCAYDLLINSSVTTKANVAGPQTVLWVGVRTLVR
jgi:hypothetical protein